MGGCRHAISRESDLKSCIRSVFHEIVDIGNQQRLATDEADRFASHCYKLVDCALGSFQRKDGCAGVRIDLRAQTGRTVDVAGVAQV